MLIEFNNKKILSINFKFKNIMRFINYDPINFFNFEISENEAFRNPNKLNIANNQNKISIK